MKLNDKPRLFRNIIGEVEHQGKVYQVTIREDVIENFFEVYELDEMGSIEKMLSPDDGLGKEIVNFFFQETEDIEQFN